MYVAGAGATVIEGGGGEEGVWISSRAPRAPLFRRTFRCEFTGREGTLESDIHVSG